MKKQKNVSFFKYNLKKKKLLLMLLIYVTYIRGEVEKKKKICYIFVEKGKKIYC